MTSARERWMLISLAAIQFTNIVDFMIMMPMGDLLQRRLEIGPEKYGWLVSSYGLAAFATAFAGVFYLDRLNRKTALMSAYFGFALATLMSAVLPSTDNQELNYALFVFTRVLTGLTGGLLGGLVYSIVGDLIPIERRGRAMAIVTMAFSFAAVIGVPLSLALVDGFDNNWRAPFLFVSALSLLILVPTALFIPRMAPKVKTGNTGIMREVFGKVKFRWALLFTFSLILGQFTVISFMTPYFINNVGLLQTDIKFIYIAGGVATIISGPIFGSLVDKYGRFKVFYISALISMIPILLITQLPQVPLFVVIMVGVFMFMMIAGRMIPANTISSEIPPPQMRAGFLSLNSAFMSLSSGISGLISGLIVSQASHGMPYENYGWVGLLAVMATLLSIFICRKLHYSS